MKITIKQVRESNAALNELGATKLPSAVALRVMLIMKALRDPSAAFDETYNKLLMDCGVPIKDQPGQFQIAPENIEEFNKESKILHAQEVEVNVKPIDVASFANIEVKPQTLLALDWMLTGLDVMVVQ